MCRCLHPVTVPRAKRLRALPSARRTATGRLLAHLPGAHGHACRAKHATKGCLPGACQPASQRAPGHAVQALAANRRGPRATAARRAARRQRLGAPLNVQVQARAARALRARAEGHAGACHVQDTESADPGAARGRLEAAQHLVQLVLEPAGEGAARALAVRRTATKAPCGALWRCAPLGVGVRCAWGRVGARPQGALRHAWRARHPCSCCAAPLQRCTRTTRCRCALRPEAVGRSLPRASRTPLLATGPEGERRGGPRAVLVRPILPPVPTAGWPACCARVARSFALSTRESGPPWSPPGPKRSSWQIHHGASLKPRPLCAICADCWSRGALLWGVLRPPDTTTLRPSRESRTHAPWRAAEG